MGRTGPRIEFCGKNEADCKPAAPEKCEMWNAVLCMMLFPSLVLRVVLNRLLTLVFLICVYINPFAWLTVFHIIKKLPCCLLIYCYCWLRLSPHFQPGTVYHVSCTALANRSICFQNPVPCFSHIHPHLLRDMQRLAYTSQFPYNCPFSKVHPSQTRSQKLSQWTYQVQKHYSIHPSHPSPCQHRSRSPQ